MGNINAVQTATNEAKNAIDSLATLRNTIQWAAENVSGNDYDATDLAITHAFGGVDGALSAAQQITDAIIPAGHIWAAFVAVRSVAYPETL